MEFDYLFSYFCKIAERFVICVDCLDDWCFGNDLFVSMLSRIGAKKLECINYSNVRDIDKCYRNLKRTVGKLEKTQFHQTPDLPFLSIKMNDGWVISVQPEDITILDSNTHICRFNYILERDA